MKTWITSDLHFGHENVLKFCPETRGCFNDAEHMNNEIVRIWNDVVADEDLIYILGDVAFMSGYNAAQVVKRLKGRKVLIEGNHDPKLLKDVHFRNCFEEIHKYHEIRYNKTNVVMFHYPIAEWNRMHYGAVHFYGHLHGSPSGLEKYRARDMGFDATGNVVTLMDAAIEDAKKGEIKGHH